MDFKDVGWQWFKVRDKGAGLKTTKMIGSGVCGAGTAGVGNVGHGDAWVRDTRAVELGPGGRDLKRVVRASKNCVNARICIAICCRASRASTLHAPFCDRTAPRATYWSFSK